ncbi:hypothetical protein BGZ88_003452 [Linnemannia elongata]|nr:hypothetical protein BGZ88_003452 [Linnemannia elongata]
MAVFTRNPSHRTHNSNTFRVKTETLILSGTLILSRSIIHAGTPVFASIFIHAGTPVFVSILVLAEIPIRVSMEGIIRKE